MNNNEKECTFIWFIENYSFCLCKTGEKLVSPVFTFQELLSPTWTLWLFPRGRNEEDKGMIFIYLHRKDNGPDVFNVTYRISIVAEDGSTDFDREYTSDFSKKVYLGWPFVEMDTLLSQRKAEYLPKDVLTVRCKLTDGKENTDKVAPIYSRTRIGIRNISFHHIEDFSSLELNYQIHSPSHMGRAKSRVYLSDGSCCEEKLMVEITPSVRGHILAKCEIYLLETSGKRVKCAEADNRFDIKRKEIRKLPLSLAIDEIMSKKRDYLPEDKLSLLCECIFSTGIEFQKIEGIQNETTTVRKLSNDDSLMEYANICSTKLSSCPNALADLKEIYISKFLTDVELKTKSNSFPVHKVLLCARSPVFKVMLSNDMKEKNSNSIPVDDLEDTTVQQLLLFVYSDSLEDLQWESAIKLYYAADKYQIGKLKLVCASYLIENLSTSTATELLLLADTHSDYDLKEVVEDFILDHDEQVFGSGEWEKLMEANPQLALKTMHLKYIINEGK